MTIEELFGTLQMSVVATWRKHLRSAKYSKHMALDEFYKEMPEKVDDLQMDASVRTQLRRLHNELVDKANRIV